MEEGAHYKPAPILASVDRWFTHRPGMPVAVPDELGSLIRDRLLAILFSQSFDIIDRGIGMPADLNLGCQIALGFRKGSFDIMRDLGDAEVDRIMLKFKAERPGFPMPAKPIAEYQNFRRFVTVDEMDGVKIITLRRPQALNALNDEVTGEILSVFKENIDDPSVKGFVITGYGTAAFSAGADIGKFPEMLGNKAASIQYARDCARVQRFMDEMDKPVVAALNGMALGGGLEIAIRCHSIVAIQGATLQFPEISLGILPAIGGCIVPYRKWPQGAHLFHDMICLGKPLTAMEAAEIGMVSKLADDYIGLIKTAVAEVHQLQGRIKRIPQGKIDVPEVKIPRETEGPMIKLSKEAVAITARTIQKGAAAENFKDALEVGYTGFGDIACSDAAKEGISAFLAKRKPEFKK
jgi:enoyl-CoA hydratase/3-hydroxyacyl-CoA dehydrogenase